MSVIGCHSAKEQFVRISSKELYSSHLIFVDSLSLYERQTVLNTGSFPCRGDPARDGVRRLPADGRL